ncbi:hypothetical protein ACHAWC_005848 [Mediolabrus comicus]
MMPSSDTNTKMSAKEAADTTAVPSSSNSTSITTTRDILSDIHSLLNDDDLTDIHLIPDSKDCDGDNGDDENDTITAVPAIKALLAARSPVFRRCLYGEWRDSQSSNQNEDGVLQMKLDYSGRVLQLLVEFCFTDKLASLTVNSTNNSNTNSMPEQKVRLLTKLNGAAHYFDIPKLEQDIQTQLKDMMLQHPSLACAILDEASKMLSGEELGLLAMSRIRSLPKAALLHFKQTTHHHHQSSHSSGHQSYPSTVTNAANNTYTGCGWGECGGVISLNASLLEQVIFDDQSSASELTKFLCLQKWVEGCRHIVSVDEFDLPRKMDDSADNNVEAEEEEEEEDEILSSRTPKLQHSKHPSKSDNMMSQPPSPPLYKDDALSDGQHEQRLIIARHLAEKLDLSLIPASDLSSTITESNLISAHNLYQAYRLQALNAERSKSKVFVEGAGLAEVNGTYIQGGVHEGTPMFSKEGVWRDREEVFRIFLCTYSNGNKSWCLSIVPKGKAPGKTTDIDFYECPVSYGKSSALSPVYGGATESVVPNRGWKLVNYGQTPVPKFSLVGGCLEDA